MQEVQNGAIKHVKDNVCSELDNCGSAATKLFGEAYEQKLQNAPTEDKSDSDKPESKPLPYTTEELIRSINSLARRVVRTDDDIKSEPKPVPYTTEELRNAIDRLSRLGR
ncbi:MAG: hypothetical protein K2X81_11435 [Candidatus Obscuribacterales bacterium]|nr:hypothetical protein [Candidatus Obscuribacterales bacterium]